MEAQKGFASICIDDNLLGNQALNAHTPPIFASSTFVYPSVSKAMEVFSGKGEDYIYSRWENPTVKLIEKKIALLEGFEHTENIEYSALAFSSGMSAIQSLFNALDLRAGDSILAQGNIYGTTVDLLNEFYHNKGINVSFKDFSETSDLEDFILNTPSLKMIYMETPCNPTLACYDIALYAKLAKRKSIPLIVDNTFSTPYFQRPLQLGADFVVHSATKFLNGHGTAIGGLVVGKDNQFISSKLYTVRKLAGTILSPFDAWLLNNGLKTLPLRMEQHQKNALEIAHFLSQHQNIESTFYPGLTDNPFHALAKQQMSGFGGVLAFTIRGGLNEAIRFMEHIAFCKITASLGTADTLIQHPASMTHVKVPKNQREAFGIRDNLIRISVGLEDVKDIIDDLENALSTV